MLVLSRKLGEQIVVPSYRVTVTVLSIEGTKVRLGISAPDEIGVYREELWVRIRDGEHDGPPARGKIARPAPKG
jgi:carbon storage regulator